MIREKELHLGAARGQRKAVNLFFQGFIEQEKPGQPLPTVILPEVIEQESHPLEEACVPIVQVQAEDFGGSLTIPHYGFQRPSADYLT